MVVGGERGGRVCCCRRGVPLQERSCCHAQNGLLHAPGLADQGDAVMVWQKGELSRSERDLSADAAAMDT